MFYPFFDFKGPGFRLDGPAFGRGILLELLGGARYLSNTGPFLVSRLVVFGNSILFKHKFFDLHQGSPCLETSPFVGNLKPSNATS